jgi:FMN phosphatase YigB (HAD superfamily)
MRIIKGRKSEKHWQKHWTRKKAVEASIEEEQLWRLIKKGNSNKSPIEKETRHTFYVAYWENTKRLYKCVIRYLDKAHLRKQLT